MKDNKMKFTMISVWWIICFIPLISIGIQISPLILKSTDFSLISIVLMVLFCAILAVVLEILLFAFVLPNMDKQRVPCEAIMKELSERGMSEQLVNYIIEQYNFCTEKINTYYMYHISYAIILAEYYCNIEDWQTAYKYLDSVNLSRLDRGLKYVSGKRLIVLYYAIRMLVDCYSDSREKAENTYSVAKSVFDRYGEEMELDGIIEMGLCCYEIVCGRMQSVIDKIEPIVNIDESRVRIRAEILAKAYTRLGNREKATYYLKKELDNAKNDFERSIVYREIEKQKQLNT